MTKNENNVTLKETLVSKADAAGRLKSDNFFFANEQLLDPKLPPKLLLNSYLQLMLPYKSTSVWKNQDLGYILCYKTVYSIEIKKENHAFMTNRKTMHI